MYLGLCISRYCSDPYDKLIDSSKKKKNKNLLLSMESKAVTLHIKWDMSEVSKSKVLK